MAELKQNRWVKVHEPGQSNFVESDNVMDILIGTGRCQAEATYTVRSYKKAGYWLGEYLKAANALQIVASEILEHINAAASEADHDTAEVTADGDGWDCVIEKMGDGSFKVQMSWAVSETVTKKVPDKKKSAAKKATTKKRSRKKTAAKAEAPEATEEVTECT